MKIAGLALPLSWSLGWDWTGGWVAVVAIEAVLVDMEVFRKNVNKKAAL